MLWNKYPPRERKAISILCEQFIGTMGIPVMETVLPDSTKFSARRVRVKSGSAFSALTILPLQGIPERWHRKGGE